MPDSPRDTAGTTGMHVDGGDGDGGVGDGTVHDGVLVPAHGARVWSWVAIVAALTAIWAPILGVVGMVAASVAHLKGDRWGMPVALASGVTTIIGMALVFFVRL